MQMFYISGLNRTGVNWTGDCFCRAGSGVSGRRVFPDIFFSHDIPMAIMRLNYETCNKNV